MKNLNDPTTGNIFNQGTGLGGKIADTLESRAQELALINGRSEATLEDREQARNELEGKAIPEILADDADSSGGLSRDPSEPLTISGRQTPNYVGLDEEKALERLTLQGVEEAQHDQMIQARRRRE